MKNEELGIKNGHSTSTHSSFLILRSSFFIRSLKVPLAILFWSIVFGISYTQAPLYYSNQNQYFLQGLADAGRGDLREDWLDNTKDPTPLFSGLVALTASYLDERCFYVYYLFVLGVYFWSLLGIFKYVASIQSPARLTGNASALSGQPPPPLATLCFVTLMILVHSGMARAVSARFLGTDYPWFFQSGVAGQYVLGFGLQPSTFGVFLIASVFAFVRGRPWLAIILACLAAVLHSTYLLAAAFLTLAYMIVRFRDRGLVQAVLLGALALALVPPAVVYNLAQFSPTSPADFAQAQHILAKERIPHHAVIERWYDTVAFLQILWILLGIGLVWRSRLGVVLGVVFPCSLALTLVELGTDNDTLALLFPWRTSAILVPIATTIVFGRLALVLERRSAHLSNSQRTVTFAAGAIAVVAAFVGGIVIWQHGLGYRTSPDELGVLNYVKRMHKPGDVYLLPIEISKPWATPWTGPRGVTNSSFMPPPRIGKAGSFIAGDLQRFRLYTGAPIYVDFKCIPYKDVEVLEWKRRITWCHEVYTGKHSLALATDLAKEGITHVVVTTGKAATFPTLGRPQYIDDAYSVYAVGKK